MSENNLSAEDVVFIDAYNIIYRAFHGNLAPLKSPDGIPTNAITTVSYMLLKLRKQFTNLTLGTSVWDGGGNFRKDLDAEYKANRKPMPEDLKIQMPYIREVFDILGWPTLQAEGVEADDVIGTLAKRASAKGYNVYIISSDKDFRQIVTDNLNIVDSMHDILYTPALVREKMGVSVDNVCAWLALNGDSADNVIGVDKWGPKTITKNLDLYGNIENLILNKDQITGVAGQNLRNAIESGQLARNIELVTLKTNLDIQLTRSQLTPQPVDEDRWADFKSRMGMRPGKSPKP